MSEPFPKSYEPKESDEKWYAAWEQADLFRAKLDQRPGFCIVIPPPNVTGRLHMGHALVNTLQDVLSRTRRMQGYDVLWLPGTDHAGISTQTVVERRLRLETGKQRKDFPREEFLSHVWKCKEENHHWIITQLKRLGCSCDWSRERFTLDEGNSLAVCTMFKRLFDQGLIYRGEYLVNWDPVTQTAIADDEVEYEERHSSLWHIKYPLENGEEGVVIATTRPETMLGDVAVAVHPEDPRYQQLIGKNLRLPLTDRLIPVVADLHVDPEFGTGAVKVTPAHDPNDYQIGKRHNLPEITVMTLDGRINAHGGKFAGLYIEEARKAVVETLREQGLLVKQEPHVHRVGLSYRSKAVVEPMLSKQWFIRMESFKGRLRDLVESGKVRLVPKNWENTYFHWIDNLRDWCISRQLWWGHRIPIWYRKDNAAVMVCSEDGLPPPSIAGELHLWEQDEDVLDTWFSSGLWPFASLGWPHRTELLEKFYPNSTLITGYDILFFWVARMLFMGEVAMEAPPFPEVFLHGLIFGKSYWREATGGGTLYVERSERTLYEHGQQPPPDVKSRWEKMSKTKGNVIDPLEVIDEFGTDAVRMALCASPSHSRQIDLDYRRFEEFKNFANKMWNGARFVITNLSPAANDPHAQPLTEAVFTERYLFELSAIEDQWLLQRYQEVVQQVTQTIDAYHFDRATNVAYDFFWNEFCSCYVEIAKPTLFGKQGSSSDRTTKQVMLLIVLCGTLRLLHPFAPFVTEELFQKVKQLFPGLLPPTGRRKGLSFYLDDTAHALAAGYCASSPFPTIEKSFSKEPSLEDEFQALLHVVYTVRNIRGEMNLPHGLATELYLIVPETESALIASLRAHQSALWALLKISHLHILTEEPAHLSVASAAHSDRIKVIVPIPQELLNKELERLQKELEKLTAQRERLQGLLNNPGFLESAPQEQVAKQQQALTSTDQAIDAIRKKLQV